MINYEKSGARGPVIEKILKELLQEDDLLPKNQQQEIDFSENNNNENLDIDEKTALVLIKSDIKKEVNEISLNKQDSNNDQYKETANSNISLPNFVEKKVKNLRRSINSEKLKENINDKKPIYPYNILITNEWIAIIKRKNDHIHGFSINGLGLSLIHI